MAIVNGFPVGGEAGGGGFTQDDLDAAEAAGYAAGLAAGEGECAPPTTGQLWPHDG